MCETWGEERRVARRWAPREPVAPVRSWDVCVRFWSGEEGFCVAAGLTIVAPGALTEYFEIISFIISIGFSFRVALPSRIVSRWFARLAMLPCSNMTF